MGVRGIGQVHVSVSDLDRSVAFYHDLLGIPLLFRVPAQSMAFLDCGGVRLYLGVPESPELHSNPLLYLTVDDVGAEHRRLREAGVAFVGEPHVVHHDAEGELWMAFLRDPDDHVLALMEQRPRGTGG